jgi:metallo-beta-lactamase family protein
MSRITFYGATGTTTGSRFYLQLHDRNFLIDCGLFQGPKKNRVKNWEPFPVPAPEIDRVLLTHAHLDHSGYLPRLCRDDFKGLIHCTHATAMLSDIILRDSAEIQEEDARWANKKGYSRHKPALPLYTLKDAEKTAGFFSPLQYGEDLYFADDFRIKFKDAGHILGSSLIDIKTSRNEQSRKIVFSGDLGRPTIKHLRDPSQVFNVDYLVMESTYGSRLHGDENPKDELMRIIRESNERGGVLIIPSFAVGRTQALCYFMRELQEEGRIPDIPIYIDSPMAIDAFKVFENRLSDCNIHSRLLVLQGKEIFRPRNLHFCESREESKTLNRIRRDAIIISASGMATAGRVLHHLEQRLTAPENTVLFVGYQPEGTRGRHLIEGREEIKIHGRMIPVNARIEQIHGFSGHADYNEILAYLMAFNKPPEKTFIVHGEPEASSSLAEKIRERYGWDVVVPEYGQSFDLDL